MSFVHLGLSILILLCVQALAYVIVRRGRSFLSRHRMLTAALMLPYQPTLLIGLTVLLIVIWEDIEIRWVVLGFVAYLNGLVAFALTTAIQDRR